MSTRQQTTVQWKVKLKGQHSMHNFSHAFNRKLDVDGAKITKVQTTVINHKSTIVFVIPKSIQHPKNVITLRYITDGLDPSLFESTLIIDVTYELGNT